MIIDIERIMDEYKGSGRTSEDYDKAHRGLGVVARKLGVISLGLVEKARDQMNKMEYDRIHKLLAEASNNGWISVNDSLPNHADKVLIHHDTYRIDTAVYGADEDGSIFYENMRKDSNKLYPTHWMQLPKPPGE